MFLCKTVVLVGLNRFVSVTKEQKVQSTAKTGRSVTMAHFSFVVMILCRLLYGFLYGSFLLKLPKLYHQQYFSMK